MSAQDYSGGDNNSADPRQSTSHTRHRREASSTIQEPAHREPAQELPGQPISLHRAQTTLEQGGTALQGQRMSLHGVLSPRQPPMPPPPLLSGVEGSSISEDFAWAPQHVRTRSAYAPPSYHHRQATSFYQPPAPAQHIRDESASDFYFLQSPHISPNLSQGPFDLLGLDAGSSMLGVSHTPPHLPLLVQQRAQRSRHTQSGSVSKQTPTRSHRHSRTLMSQSGNLPFPSAPGYPEPLIASHPEPDSASSSRISSSTGSHMGPQSRSRPSNVPAASSRSNAESSQDSRSMLGASSSAHSGPDAPSLFPEAPEPAGSTPIVSLSGMGTSYSGFSAEVGSPGPPAWHEPVNPRSHLSEKSVSPNKKHRVGNRRHSRRRTRERNVSARYSSQQSPSVLTAANPMSDFNYSSQGYQYHGLGIGLAGQETSGPPGPPGTSVPGQQQQQQLTPILASPQLGSGFGSATPGFLGDTPVSAPLVPPPPPPSASVLQPQFQYMDRLSLCPENTPVLRSMPFLPPYVSYEQQLQQQREQEQQELHLQHLNLHPHPHKPQQQQQQVYEPQQSQLHEDDVWQHDYWGFQRYERPPIPGPSSAPSHTLESYRSIDSSNVQPSRPPAWPADFPLPTQVPASVPTSASASASALASAQVSAPALALTPDPASASASVPVLALAPASAPVPTLESVSTSAPVSAPTPTPASASVTAPGQASLENIPELAHNIVRTASGTTSGQSSTLPSITNVGIAIDWPNDPTEISLDVPGPNYDDSARIDWSVEDMEELMRLLEPAEKYKWKYMSDLLTETRKKRIPLRTCQNKFHALFGETESSSKLRSSLFYVAYRSGWDSIRESSTMREREAEVSQQQSEMRTTDNEINVEDNEDSGERSVTGSEKGSEKAATVVGSRE